MGTSKLSRKPEEMLGVTCDGQASNPGRVAILLVASCRRCYGNKTLLCDTLSEMYQVKLFFLNRPGSKLL